jgi:putative thioredoxin
MGDLAKDVTDDTFAQEVLERSRTVPVLVDLWAPWCGPCRALGPILERVADDAEGAFDLVKINVDENPVIAAQLGARSIPLVVAFKDGEPVSSFVGAQPESVIRQLVAELLPSEEDRMVDDAVLALEQGRAGDAETILRTVLEGQPRHARARLVLAGLLGEDDRIDEALEVLSRADPSPEVDQLRSALRLAVTEDEDLGELRAKAGTGDVDAAISLSHALVAQDDAESALQVLLSAVQRDPRGKESAARQAMLDIFTVLGGNDPLVRNYRAQLARALF